MTAPSYFFRINFKPLPADCKIFSHAIMQSSKKPMYYFIAGDENGGERFSIAINQSLLKFPPDQMKGIYLKDIIKDDMTDGNQHSFFIIEGGFSEKKGTVEAARTFRFGDYLLSEILLKKDGEEYKEEESIHIAFFPRRRYRKQGLSLAGKKIQVNPSFVKTKIRGKDKMWDGKNF